MDNSVYAQRRAALAAQLGAGGVAIVPTAPEQQRNRDSNFPFRHDSYFYYLTGFTEPHAWLVLRAEGTSILFCQPKDLEREIWDGFRLGPAQATASLGVDAAYSVDELNTQLPRLLENCSTVWYPFATHKELESLMEGWLQAVRVRARHGVTCPHQLHDVCHLLDAMRLVKDISEQATMRRAAHISAQAHVRAMQTCARMLHAGQEVREYHLEAELLHEFRRHGAQYPAYTSIVAAGANACVLHYRADAGLVCNGELVLIDAGCELDGYASDITRTFPANGRFTGPQRVLYDLVLCAQEAAVASIRVGARFTDPHDAVLQVLAQGMLDVGLLKKNTVGSVDDVLAQKAYLPFYMHRTSHWLGMDVHDCGSYVQPVEATPGADPAPQPLARTLQAGMVLTVEPGIYVRPAAGVPEEFHHIGIRIEDDALVNDAGCELMSRGVPVQAQEIEALMRG